MNASPAPVPSTASIVGGARDLVLVLEQDRALLAERDRDEPVPPRQRLELVAVHDRDVRVDRDRPRWGSVQAEEPRAGFPRGHHRSVRNLQLAEHGVMLG